MHGPAAQRAARLRARRPCARARAAVALALRGRHPGCPRRDGRVCGHRRGRARGALRGRGASAAAADRARRLDHVPGRRARRAAGPRARTHLRRRDRAGAGVLDPDPLLRRRDRARRRAGERPLERGCTRAPRVVRRLPAGRERPEEVDEEDRDPRDRDQVADRRDIIPVGEGRGVIGNSPRHSVEPEKVHREEDHVHPDEHQEEVQLAEQLVVHLSAHLREPIIEAAEDREHRTEAQHVMEVRHDIIGVLHVIIDASVREHDAGDAADGEQEDEADREQHWRLEGERSAPHGRDPAEHLHAGRNGDDHRCRSEVHLLIDAHAGGEHVMRPDDEADQRNRDHRIDHSEIAEDGLAAEGRDDLTDHPEPGNDHDVDFGMAEEPEQVLVEDDIAAGARIEEGRAEVTVGQKHGDRAREHRQ